MGLFRGFFVVFSWLSRGPHFGQILRVLALEQSSEFGVLRNGPPFHGSRSSREIKLQNASCQMGGREVTVQ